MTIKPKFKVGDRIKTTTKKGEVLHGIVFQIGPFLLLGEFPSKEEYIHIRRDITNNGKSRGDPNRKAVDLLTFEGISHNTGFKWELVSSTKRKIV